MYSILMGKVYGPNGASGEFVGVGFLVYGISRDWEVFVGYEFLNGIQKIRNYMFALGNPKTS